MEQVRTGKLRQAVETLKGCADFGYGALHLAHALRYLGEREAATHHFARAYERARKERDGVLAIAALCGQGEGALDTGDRRLALERFGKALGLTELSGNEALTVLPLAGLAQAQLLWGNRKKAAALGERALTRAHATQDASGTARTLLSLGVITGEAAYLEESVQTAQGAPHRPLELRARVAFLQRYPDPEGLEQALTLARTLEMHPELETLRALEESLC